MKRVPPLATPKPDWARKKGADKDIHQVHPTTAESKHISLRCKGEITDYFIWLYIEKEHQGKIKIFQSEDPELQKRLAEEEAVYNAFIAESRNPMSREALATQVHFWWL